MVNYKKNIIALECTWIQRILQSNATWKKLLESELKICIDKLCVLGKDLIKNLEVFQTWSNVYHTRGQSTAEF